MSSIGYQKSEFCLKQGRKISDICLKQGQDMRGGAAPPHPGIYRVPPRADKTNELTDITMPHWLTDWPTDCQADRKTEGTTKQSGHLTDLTSWKTNSDLSTQFSSYLPKVSVLSINETNRLLVQRLRIGWNRITDNKTKKWIVWAVSWEKNVIW